MKILLFTGCFLIVSVFGSAQSGALSSKELEAVESNIYYVQVEKFTILKQKVKGLSKKMRKKMNELQLKWNGTGFITSDGKFITARHVLEPWRYVEDKCDPLVALNNFIERGGKVDIVFKATASGGQDSFTFTNNRQLYTFDESKDERSSYKCSKRTTGCKKITAKLATTSSTDWVYIQMGNRPSNLVFNRELSKNLDRGEPVHLLSFGLGLHLQQGYTTANLDPTYSQGIVSQKDLANGLLSVSNSAFVPGSSGSPVFVRRGDEYIVIGLACNRIGQIGFVVPTYNFR